MTTLTAPVGFVMLAVGAKNTQKPAVAIPTESGIFLFLISSFGQGGVDRKAIRMTGFMFLTPCPPYALKKASGGNHSQPGDDTMSKLALTFHNTRFNVIDRNGQIWLTSAEIAQAIGYASEKSVSNLYARNADEFTPAMTQVIKVMTSGNYQKEVRIFSLRGAHLIGMFARTPIAKEFRKWVLDVLDRETVRVGPTQQPYDATNLNGSDLAIAQAVQTLIERARYLVGFWHQYGPAIRMLNSDLANGVHDCVWDADWSSSLLAKKLGIPIAPREYFQNYPFDKDSFERKRYYLAHGVSR